MNVSPMTIASLQPIVLCPCPLIVAHQALVIVMVDLAPDNWIRSFLLGRTQKVLVEVNFSIACVTSGVPQGTALGPFACQPEPAPGPLFADDCMPVV